MTVTFEKPISTVSGIDAAASDNTAWRLKVKHYMLDDCFKGAN